MAKQHIIPIMDGEGNANLVDDLYTVTADVDGYDNTSIKPNQLDIVTGTNQYRLTIAATGTLTLHVTDDGTEIGVPIIGATFVRCDSTGTTYGNPITSDVDGNAVFNAVPYGATAPKVYFKQTGSDGSHIFNPALQNTTLTNPTKTVQIMNPEADMRFFNLTDAHYPNLPIPDADLTLEG